MTNLACSLDSAVHRATEDLQKRGVPAPDALYFLGTGVGLLPTTLGTQQTIALGEVPGVPPAWRESNLHVGELGGAALWIVEDLCGDPRRDDVPFEEEEAWAPGFPVWLASNVGASFCVHTSAGVLCDNDRADDLLGRLVVLEDHLNLSGQTPLSGLGDSHLGPLFPDQTDLHHGTLRNAVLAHAERLGVPMGTALGACTLGPSLLTQAEREYCRRAGAHLAVQGLASPLIASAHAGLGALSIVAVTDDGQAGLDIRGIVEQTEKLAPALDDLLTALCRDVAELAREMRDV